MINTGAGETVVNDDHDEAASCDPSPCRQHRRATQRQHTYQLLGINLNHE